MQTLQLKMYCARTQTANFCTSRYVLRLAAAQLEARSARVVSVQVGVHCWAMRNSKTYLRFCSTVMTSAGKLTTPPNSLVEVWHKLTWQIRACSFLAAPRPPQGLSMTRGMVIKPLEATRKVASHR